MSMSNVLEKDRKYVKPVLLCGEGKTKQSFAKKCDINSIVARYQKTGLLDHVRENPGVFTDVSQIVDYPEMVRKIRFAQESFEQLPASLRTRFDNDPEKLIKFVSDSKNLSEAIELGIVPKPVKTLPAAVVVPVKAEESETPSKAAPKESD